jgi:hypothetical protein
VAGPCDHGGEPSGVHKILGISSLQAEEVLRLSKYATLHEKVIFTEIMACFTSQNSEILLIV